MKKIFIYLFPLYILTINFLLAQSVTFVSFGDWGRDGKYLQKETGDAIGRFADKNKTDFVILLGDNIYEHGVTSVDDPKWQTSFEQVYTAPSVQKIPWYAALGNHDYGGNVQAQIDYSAKSNKWKMPARKYSFEKNIDDSTTILFVIIDTSPFVTSYKTVNKGNDELSDASVTELGRMEPSAELQWIDSVLSHTKAKWKVVAGHHPVYSGGEHGNTSELVELLKPVLEKNNVNLYLCGHDHDMQYLKAPESNVNYFVSGAGSKLRGTGKMEYTLFNKSVNGFLAVTVTNSTVTAKFIDYQDNEVYKTELK
jgi:3',5'-cyclic AMP phosphodiesterase CpdA